MGKAWRKSLTRAKRASLTRLSPVSLSVFSLVPDLFFDCSRVLEYAKIRTVFKLGSLTNYDDDQNDNFKKQYRFNDQKNSSARALRFLAHFFDVHCTTTT